MASRQHTGKVSDETERCRRLTDAQNRAAELFEAIGSEAVIAAGMTESEAAAAVYELAAERFGVARHWHKRIIRSGPNTLRPYHENPPDRRIEPGDIVFADLGPVFDGWEADFGRTWVLGEDPLAARLVADLPEVFSAGRSHFEAHPDITAAELYGEVTRLARERGWQFGNFHCGHLVGEFPHENFEGSKLDSLIAADNHGPMRRLDPSGLVARWILEIHLVDTERRIGGFHEELLNV